MIAAEDKEFFDDFLAKFSLINQLLTMMINDQAQRTDMEEFDFEFDLLKRSCSMIQSFDAIMNKFIKNPSKYSNASIGIVFTCASLSLIIRDLIKIIQKTTKLALQGKVDQRQFIEMIKRLVVLNDLISEAEKLDVMKQLVKKYDFTAKIKALNRNSADYKALDQYCKVSKSFNLSLEGHSELVGKIKIIVDDVFKEGMFKVPSNPHNFIALVGPYYFGKTQSAFNLSRQNPIFYVNFKSGKKGVQAIYHAFNQISELFKQVLTHDLSTLATKSFKPEISSLFDFRRIEYKTVGLLWSLVELSQQFDWNDSSKSWFKFYLAEREIEYDAMSVFNFWLNMSINILIIMTLTHLLLLFLIGNLGPSIKNRYPIVFVDECDKSDFKIIKLLRNLSSVLTLPSIMTATDFSLFDMDNANIVR